VGHGNDVDAIRLDRVEELVREAAEEQAAYLAALDLGRKRPVS